jgi:hypothetical protein
VLEIHSRCSWICRCKIASLPSVSRRMLPGTASFIPPIIFCWPKTVSVPDFAYKYRLTCIPVHPLAIRPPYSTATATPRPFSRGPPLTSPFPESDSAVRGVGISRIEHIVGYNDVPFKGFLALLVAINAPPGSFNITGPGPDLARPGFDAYNQLYSQPSIPNGLGGKGRLRMLPGRSASKDAHGSNGSAISGYAALFSTLIQTVCSSSPKVSVRFLTNHRRSGD